MTLPIMPKGMGEITPMFGVIVLSFWIMIRQELLPYYSVFILGLFHDAMIGTLFGIGSLALIVIKLVVVAVGTNTPSSIFRSSKALSINNSTISIILTQTIPSESDC